MLDVKSRNARALGLYRSEGFTEEGRLRECLVEADGFESLVIMSVLESEYATGRQGTRQRSTSDSDPIR